MASDPRLSIARTLYERLNDRDQVVSAMRSRGYGEAEARAAVDEVAPKPAPKRPAPAPVRPAPASKAATQPQGAPRPSDPTPASSRSNGRGSSLFTGSGRGLKMPRGSRPTLSLPRRPTVGGTLGFGAGMLGYVLFLTYLRYGGDGVKGWFGAKFVNQPWQPPAPAPRARARGPFHHATDPRVSTPDIGLTSTKRGSHPHHHTSTAVTRKGAPV